MPYTVEEEQAPFYNSANFEDQNSGKPVLKQGDTVLVRQTAPST
mgnify:CR=1 FL=1